MTTTKNYEYITTGTRAEEVCKIMLDTRSVGLDTETTGVDPHKDVVTLLSLSHKNKGTFVVDTRNPKLLAAFSPLFEKRDTIKIVHNGPFDYQMIKGTVGAETENIICTLLGEKCLTAGKQFDGYSLADITLKYLNKERDKTIRDSFIGHTGEFSEEQLQYAADDTSDLPHLADIMHEKAIAEGVLETWKTESGAVQAFADIEYYGQLVNKDKWSDIIVQQHKAAEIAKKKLDECFKPVCGYNLFGELDMNYESPVMVLSKLKQLGITVDGALIGDTNKKTQKKIKEHPIMIALSAYRSAQHGINQFGEQYIKAIHPVTGRVHFRFNQYGTETGRPACRGGLNCLNIPRDTRYRSAFEAGEDRLISTVDYSGAELRIMADLSGDPLMVNGFNSGTDFHCFVASLLFNLNVTKTNEHKGLRTPTKELSFGLAYGMGPKSLWEKLNANGYKISFEDCQKLFFKYMDTFNVTIGWLRSQQRQASKEFVMTNRNGRKRHWFQPNEKKLRASVEGELEKKKMLEKSSELQIQELVRQKRKGQLAAIEREGANFNIQSVNADFTKVAMARCRLKFKDMGWGPATEKGARTYNSVYDEIVYSFHKDFATEGHEIQKKIMIDAANEMLKRVPMEVDGHLATHWQK